MVEHQVIDKQVSSLETPIWWFTIRWASLWDMRYNDLGSGHKMVAFMRIPKRISVFQIRDYMHFLLNLSLCEVRPWVSRPNNPQLVIVRFSGDLCSPSLHALWDSVSQYHRHSSVDSSSDFNTVKNLLIGVCEFVFSNRVRSLPDHCGSKT